VAGASASDLTVAVTGPTGDIGIAALRALDASPAVAKVIGMARRPFDPAAHGLSDKVVYQRGDVLDRPSVDALVDGADVVVHLAFIIIGDPDEAQRINTEGSRNVFDATVGAGAKRLVYTSSVAAYGFHADNPQPLTEEVPPRGSEDFYYSAHKAELERVLDDAIAGSGTEAYVFRPCIVAGAGALTLIETTVRLLPIYGQLRLARRALEQIPFLGPVLPDPGAEFQLVHTLDVEQSWRRRIRGEPRETWDLELDEAGFASVESLEAAWRLDQAEMLAWLDALNQAALDAIVDLGPKDRFPLATFLLHIVTHSAQQRRDVALLLERAGHPPPEIEFLNYADARPASGTSL